MKLKDTFVTQEMDGEQVMVEADGGFAGMVRSNATAAFIIDQLKTETTKEAILDAMEKKYDASRAVMTEDVDMVLGKPLILINRQLDKQTKQMVCGYALGHYLEHQLLMDLHTLNKFLTIKDKHILLYEHNAFTSHLMLDSDEVYQMTKRGLDAVQISTAKRIHLNLVLVKLLELHHLGYDLRHYHAQHHAFIKQFNLPAHFQFDVAAG